MWNHALTSANSLKESSDPKYDEIPKVLLVLLYQLSTVLGPDFTVSDTFLYLIHALLLALPHALCKKIKIKTYAKAVNLRCRAY